MIKSNKKLSTTIYLIIILILNPSKIICQTSDIGLGISSNILRPANFLESSKHKEESSISYLLVTSDFGVFYGQEIFKNLFVETKIGFFKKSFVSIYPNRADATINTPGHNENCDHFTSTDKFIYASIKLKYYLSFLYKNLYLSGGVRKLIYSKNIFDIKFINNGDVNLNKSYERNTYDLNIPLNFQIGIGNQFKLFNKIHLYIEPNIIIGDNLDYGIKHKNFMELLNIEFGIII